MYYLKLCIILILGSFYLSKALDLDPLGYVLYCPCMGRFGNQADHFLGALAFAKGLNRTLALPAWVEYRYGERKSIQVPFDTYFKVKSVQNYHKVITMESFMEKIAPIEWPPDRRISFCYMARGTTPSCNAKEGNPFGPFWDTYGVDFVKSEFYEPLNYDIHNQNVLSQWLSRYPASHWPVLAFTGAPASFPVAPQNRVLHKYLEWSQKIENESDNYIKTILPKGAFIGIHLRNGVDWVRACELIPRSPNLFAAPQCLGYRNENGNATPEMCLPTKETIVKQLKRVVKHLNNSLNNTVKSIFVASDHSHMINELQESLKKMEIKVYKLKVPDPHVDLAILAKANHFIGNCISSFSAFVKRERDAKGFKSSFWAFPVDRSSKKSLEHDEL